MVSEQTITYVAILIMILVGIFLFIYFLDQMTGGHLIRNLVCGALFWLGAFGSAFTSLTEMCAAIPA